MTSSNVFAASWSKGNVKFSNYTFTLSANTKGYPSQSLADYHMSYNKNGKYKGTQQMNLRVYYPKGVIKYEGFVSGKNKPSIHGKKSWLTTGGPTSIQVEYCVNEVNTVRRSAKLFFTT